MRAARAQSARYFARETVPVDVPDKRGTTVVATHEHPRPQITLEGLAKLKAAFPSSGKRHEQHPWL